MIDRIAQDMISSLIEKLMVETKTFKLWTEDPLLFFNQSAEALQLSELTLKQRLKSFIRNAAKQTLKVNTQNRIRRLDSIIAYLRFQRHFPSLSYLTRNRVKPFLEYLELPTGPEEQSECYELLSSGRRGLELCYILSKDDTDFKSYDFDAIRFDDIDYSVLFLELDDRIWDISNGWAYKLFKKTIEELKSQDFITKSRSSGVTLVAQTLLQYRQAFIEKGVEQPYNAANNSMVASNRSSAEVESDSTEMSNYSRTEPDSDSTVASKCSSTVADSDSTETSNFSSTEADPDSTEMSNYSSTEPNSDSTEASKHSSTKRARAESELDDTRTSKRARTVSDLDSTRASEPASSDIEEDSSMVASECARREGRLDILLQAAEWTGQNAAVSEATIADPSSTLHNLRSNNEPFQNSETPGAFFEQGYHQNPALEAQNTALHTQNPALDTQNLVMHTQNPALDTQNVMDTKDGDPGGIDGITGELSLEDEDNAWNLGIGIDWDYNEIDLNCLAGLSNSWFDDFFKGPY
ncbi:hypothetical protein GGI35DRAFT_453305 [Trichoderma velutinum]